jgi:hypothetical protein
VRTRRLMSLLIVAGAVFASLIPGTAPAETPASHDAAHDFDFEIGVWKTHIKRLVKPLTQSTTWVEYDGTSVIRPVWDGRANLIELEVTGPSGHLELLSLRLYDPETRRWSLNVASSRTGTLSPPAIGGFENGRGEFFDQEQFDGRPILVRFVVTRVGADTNRVEQSFSADWGKTWELNWVATDTRVTP